MIYIDPELQNKGMKSKNEVLNVKFFCTIFIEHTLRVNVKKDISSRSRDRENIDIDDIDTKYVIVKYLVCKVLY